MGESLQDQFHYTVSDGHGGTSVATVNITIQGVNDGPVAVNDSVSVVQGNNGSFSASSLLANDSDPDVHDILRHHGVDANSSQGIALSFANGIVSYASQNAFSSLGVGESLQDQFHYTVSDGSWRDEHGDGEYHHSRRQCGPVA